MIFPAPSREKRSFERRAALGAVDYLFLCLSILYLWPRPLLLGAVLVVNLYFLSRFIIPWRTVRFLRTAAAAALLGGVGEYLCVRVFALWSYAPPTVAGLPPWVPIVWANLFLLFIFYGEGLAARAPRVPSPLRVLFSAAFLFYLGSAFGRVHPAVAAGFAVATAVCVVYFRARPDVASAVVGGIVGTMGEVLAMRAGYWKYSSPVLRNTWFNEVLGVEGLPITLPLAWGVSAILIRRAGGGRSEQDA